MSEQVLRSVDIHHHVRMMMNMKDWFVILDSGCTRNMICDAECWMEVEDTVT